MNSEFDYIKFYTDIFKAFLHHEVGIFIILCAIYFLVFGIFFYKKIKNKLYRMQINKEHLLYILHGITAILFIAWCCIWIKCDNAIPFFPFIPFLLLIEWVCIRSSDDSNAFLYVLNYITILFSVILYFICNTLHFTPSTFPTIFFVSIIDITLIMLSDARFSEKTSSLVIRAILGVKIVFMLINLTLLFGI